MNKDVKKSFLVGSEISSEQYNAWIESGTKLTFRIINGKDYSDKRYILSEVRKYKKEFRAEFLEEDSSLSISAKTKEIEILPIFVFSSGIYRNENTSKLIELLCMASSDEDDELVVFKVQGSKRFFVRNINYFFENQTLVKLDDKITEPLPSSNDIIIRCKSDNKVDVYRKIAIDKDVIFLDKIKKDVVRY